MVKQTFLYYCVNKSNPNSYFMPRVIFEYTKSVLERVSFDARLFCKELEKAVKVLLPYEVEQLREWLLNFTKEKPELRQCLRSINP